eukprot:3911869-Heterocapsa_arctica.AAC.1
MEIPLARPPARKWKHKSMDSMGSSVSRSPTSALTVDEPAMVRDLIMLVMLMCDMIFVPLQVFECTLQASGDAGGPVHAGLDAGQEVVLLRG